MDALLGAEAGFFAAHRATLERIANSAPPVGAHVTTLGARERGAPFECGAIFTHVFVAHEGEHYALPVAPFPETHGTVVELLRTLESRGLRLYAHAAVVRALSAAATCAPVVRAIGATEKRFFATLALALVADDAHAAQMLACVASPWQRTRVALLRAGAHVPRARPAPAKAESAGICAEIGAASPIARIMQGATALQIVALCVVGVAGTDALACVFAAMAVGAAHTIMPATATALARGARAAVAHLPASVRAILVPDNAAIGQTVHGVAMLLAGLGVVPGFVAHVAAGLVPEARSEYAASASILGAAVHLAREYSARDALKEQLVRVTETAGAAAWIRAGFEGADGTHATAMASYMSAVEATVLAQTAAKVLVAKLRAALDANAALRVGALVEPVAVKLLVCALVSGSGVWGDVPFVEGTLLAYIAWYNPVFAEALRFCTPK
jgi:hypothetical protein